MFLPSQAGQQAKRALWQRLNWLQATEIPFRQGCKGACALRGVPCRHCRRSDACMARQTADMLARQDALKPSLVCGAESLCVTLQLCVHLAGSLEDNEYCP